MNLKSLIIFTMFCSGFISCNDKTDPNSPKYILVGIPFEKSGVFFIFFDQKNVHELDEKNSFLFAPIISDTLRSSTSLKHYKKSHFAFFRYDGNNPKDMLLDSSGHQFNYSYCYITNSEKLLGHFKNKEFYIGCFYNDQSASSEDSLKKFLSSINADSSSISKTSLW